MIFIFIYHVETYLQLNICHVETLLHMTICHMEIFFHMTDFFSTSTAGDAGDKYQVCLGPLWSRSFCETNLPFGRSLTCFLDIVLIAEYPVFCVDCTVFVRKTGANQVGQGGSAQSGGSMGRQSMNRMGTTTVGQLLKGSN